MEIKTYEDMRLMAKMDDQIIIAIRSGLNALDALHEARSSLLDCSLSSVLANSCAYIRSDTIYESSEELLGQIRIMEHDLRKAIDEWTRESNRIEDAIEHFKEEDEKNDASA